MSRNPAEMLMKILHRYNKQETPKNKDFCLTCRALTDDLTEQKIHGCMHCQSHLGKPLFKFIDGDYLQIPIKNKKVGKKSLASYIKKMSALLEKADSQEQADLIKNSIDLAVALEKEKHNLKQDLVKAIEQQDIPKMKAVKAELQKIIEQCLEISKEA